MSRNIAFVASNAGMAQEAQDELIRRYGNVAPAKADVIVALGGDGFMLQTLHETKALSAPVYGMNCGTVGFLMNEYSPERLVDRLLAAEEMGRFCRLARMCWR